RSGRGRRRPRGEPAGGRELRDATRRRRRDALDHVAEVGERIELEILAAHDERVDRRGPARTGVAAREEPVLAADGDLADRALDRVVVNREPPVLDVARERRAELEGVADRHAERALRQDEVLETLEHSEEVGQERSRMLVTESSSTIDVERLLVRLSLDRIELPDRGEDERRLLGLAVERLVEPPPRVRPAADLDHTAALVE